MATIDPNLTSFTSSNFTTANKDDDDIVISSLSNSTATATSSVSSVNLGTINTTTTPISTWISSPNVSGNYYSTASSWNWNDYIDMGSRMDLLVATYLSEEEIDDLLTKIQDRLAVVKSEEQENTFESVVGYLVRSRHFTEEFLLKYYDYCKKSDILRLHAADISLGTYPRLALLITNDDNKE